MSLPRFELPEEEQDDDSTAPAQFVLKLPESYTRRLATLRPPPPTWPTPSVPWTIETVSPAPTRERTKLAAVIASIAAFVLIAVSVGGALAQAGGGPVGVSRRAPKSLERSVRASARQSGFTAHVPTVSIDSLKRAHTRRRR